MLEIKLFFRDSLHGESATARLIARVVKEGKGEVPAKLEDFEEDLDQATWAFSLDMCLAPASFLFLKLEVLIAPFHHEGIKIKQKQQQKKKKENFFVLCCACRRETR